MPESLFGTEENNKETQFPETIKVVSLLQTLPACLLVFIIYYLLPLCVRAVSLASSV